ncbi:restriction endonuclease [Xanthomonadaceae bacterium JHOS43]|nr:restriction endonuclease [Xanthomonadaceae bacterium JHOS43]MCX7563740.1 restriction endonuclease [Xanthomonadaceae bacterium XH05]
MGVTSLLAYPLLFALISLVVAFFATAWLLGVFRTERDEARAGIALLCAMRWNEFSRLIAEVLKDRGMQPANAERSPGQDGFDLLFMRGNSRYLVLCKNGATQRITAAAVGQLHTLTQMQDADGAIIASCAPGEPAALKLAQERRIEVMADLDLWRHVKPWIAHDQRIDAEAAANAMRRKRLLIAASSALIAAFATYAAIALLGPKPSPPADVAARTPVAAARPVPAPTAVALPDTDLSEEQLASRRAATVLEVRGLTRVSSASWSTRSTLQIGLHDAISDTDLAILVEDVCRSLLQHEELRFTRLQVEVPTGSPDQPMQVRWRQCR